MKTSWFWFILLSNYAARLMLYHTITTIIQFICFTRMTQVLIYLSLNQLGPPFEARGSMQLCVTVTFAHIKNIFTNFKEEIGLKLDECNPDKTACKTVTGSSLCTSWIALKPKKVQPLELPKPEEKLIAFGILTCQIYLVYERREKRDTTMSLQKILYMFISWTMPSHWNN